MHGHVSFRDTLPKTNIDPENRPSEKETIVFQPSIFGCQPAVSFREGRNKQLIMKTKWVFPKIVVPQKWMVYFMENPIKHGMIWGYHYFWKHPNTLQISCLRRRKPVKGISPCLCKFAHYQALPLSISPSTTTSVLFPDIRLKATGIYQ